VKEIFRQGPFRKFKPANGKVHTSEITTFARKNIEGSQGGPENYLATISEKSAIEIEIEKRI
jgi:hypothetical protein